ncbi:Manganese ABC transporter, ATP-binding protein [Richelia intracellularis HH01]|uniref:Manganese ABC transporter, ATP-binding protein n=1 Tax=Richelia intracellularis HH01 TaxID=1165094 RepID=M1WX54_9NOST|nr:metal ABC transporter ATP-binding protein [Richelia intracellularis]CCH66177.1 Manganese ABC transporter, ATP-binding protein [Richelia intracellularis HH01]
MDITNTPNPILDVDGLNVSRGKYLILRDISFELLPKTNMAIVGPNGAGKTTLVQAILNLIPHMSGRVQILGCPNTKMGKLGYLLGYIAQNFIFNRSFPLSVSELVGLGWVGSANIYKNSNSLSKLWQIGQEKSAAINQALKRTNAYHLRNQAIGTLSCGQLKRVLLAYCLVIPRKLLILDEAFTGLDIQGSAHFYILLNQLKQEEGWTILQISHDIDMVNRHCDRVICLNQTIICTGVPEVAFSADNMMATYGPGFSCSQHQFS